MNILLLSIYEPIPKSYTGLVQRPDRHEWCKGGLLHRINNPAREWATGSKEWYFRNKIHCTQGKARETKDGLGSYWLFGYTILQEASIIIVY